MTMAGIHILWADGRFLRKRYIRCPSCECTTEMVVRYEAWYGNTWYCCRCGDSWQEEGMNQRPFERGWRRKAIARHRALWDAATHGPDPTPEQLYPLHFMNGGLGPMVDVELPVVTS